MPRYYLIDASGARKDRYGTLHKTKKDARAELTALLHSLNTGSHVERSAETVAEWLREWLELWTPEAGPKAKERYRENLDWYVLPQLGARALQDIETADVQRLYRDLHATGRRRPRAGQSAGVQVGTLATLHGILKRALAQAVALKKLRANPCDGVKLPKAQKEIEARPARTDGAADIHDCLSQQQLTRLLDRSSFQRRASLSLHDKHLA